MIARIWHGAVPIGKSAEYLKLMRSVGLDGYRETPGNKGAFVLHETSGDVVHILMLTFWESFDAIKQYAGDNVNRAKYYDFDPEFLIELEPGVKHYEVHSEA